MSVLAVKSLVIELSKILEGLIPNYLSEPVEKQTLLSTLDIKLKLVQPIKRTNTYGLRSFHYYGAHVRNMLPVNMEAAQSLSEFNTLIRSWPGPTFSCHICVALLWLMLILYIIHWGRGLSVWRLCRFLWYRGLSLWQPVIPSLAVGSSQWQLLSF